MGDLPKSLRSQRTPVDSHRHHVSANSAARERPTENHARPTTAQGRPTKVTPPPTTARGDPAELHPSEPEPTSRGRVSYVQVPRHASRVPRRACHVVGPASWALRRGSRIVAPAWRVPASWVPRHGPCVVRRGSWVVRRVVLRGSRVVGPVLWVSRRRSPGVSVERPGPASCVWVPCRAFRAVDPTSEVPRSGVLCPSSRVARSAPWIPRPRSHGRASCVQAPVSRVPRRGSHVRGPLSDVPSGA
ncbi:hypothetical protein SAMN05421869_1361 [Nonomuraea jiangxiensis]|uniref:Uncharacterized protein n=1 Tax=Nonomuraea jiangxiensis TaxID=633440 RepID=A0A1G9QFW4_9ACTN|nr:hypothetical protein SAMN05421869_1361 [Nonomuraea jiangxiensis]